MRHASLRIVILACTAIGAIGWGTLTAHADEYVNASLATLTQSADVIVVGHSTQWQGGFTATVSETLKGKAARHIDVDNRRLISPTNCDTKGNGEVDGIFFLKNVGVGDDVFDLAQPPGCARLKDRARVVHLIAMLHDLKSFVDDPRLFDDEDLVGYVSDAFATPRIQCDEAPGIGDYVALDLRLLHPPRWVWREKSSWPVHLTFDRRATPEFTVLDAGKEPSIADALGRLTVAFSREQFDTLDLHCTVDAGWPAQAGRLRAPDAVRFVRGRLRSANKDVVVSALYGLKEMHDLESVHLVLPLLRHRNPEVKSRAAEFLVAADDPAAVPAIVDALKRTSAARELRASDTLACAAEQFNIGKVALPEWRRLADEGSEEAMSALGRNGDESDVERLLGLRPFHYALDSALFDLISRSDLPPEAWMKPGTFGAPHGDRTPLWAGWWGAHRGAFHIGAARTAPKSDCFLFGR